MTLVGFLRNLAAGHLVTCLDCAIGSTRFRDGLFRFDSLLAKCFRTASWLIPSSFPIALSDRGFPLGPLRRSFRMTSG